MSNVNILNVRLCNISPMGGNGSVFEIECEENSRRIKVKISRRSRRLIL